MKTTKTDAQVVRDAMDLLREHGHCKFLLYDDAGRMCLVGALNLAHAETKYGVFFNKQRPHLANILLQVTEEQHPDRFSGWDDYGAGYVWFNNHPDTTLEDVLSVMDKTAVLLDETS